MLFLPCLFLQLSLDLIQDQVLAGILACHGHLHAQSPSQTFPNLSADLFSLSQGNAPYDYLAGCLAMVSDHIRQDGVLQVFSVLGNQELPPGSQWPCAH